MTGGAKAKTGTAAMRKVLGAFPHRWTAPTVAIATLLPRRRRSTNDWISLLDDLESAVARVMGGKVAR